MKPHIRPLATALAAALQLAAIAAVPVAWTNSPGMPPYPIKPGADVRLWYQTNGMGSA